MGTNRGNRKGDTVKCQGEGERAQEDGEKALGRETNVVSLEAERLRRARKLPFSRDRTSYVQTLRDALVPHCPAIAENVRCKLDANGVLSCEFAEGAPPREDCRRAWCPHAPLMRMRLLGRLRAYVESLKKRDGRS